MSEREAVREVWREPEVEAARAHLVTRDGDTMRAQVAVCEIAAPTGDESRRAEWMSEQFRALGLADVRQDEAGNVIALRPGTDPDAAPVVLCAHLDTVFPADLPVQVRQEGNRFTAPGIGDNGRGLAALLALAGALQRGGVRTRAPIQFVCTTGEEGEGNLAGARHLFANGARQAAAAIILDGAGDDRVVHKALGSRRYRIEFRGPGGHSWAAFGTANAVHAAAACATRLAALQLPTDPRTTLSVGRIGGGIAVNAIPAEAWLEVDVRSTDARVIATLDQRLRGAVRAVEREENARRAKHTEPLTSAVAVIGDRPCGELDAMHPLVRAAMEATRLIGREPALATASTDANVPISLGIPAIAIGAGGRGGDAHTPDEWYENAEGALGLERALGVVLAQAGLAR